MTNPPLTCLTVSGSLIVNDKVLLVKHRKAGHWLQPGGHVEDGELPHLAAVREFAEETGIAVKLVPFGLLACLPEPEAQESEYVPAPFACNTHWISHENYDQRVASGDLEKRTVGGVWYRGCEVHYHMAFWLELADPAQKIDMTKFDARESDDMQWFSLNEVAKLEMPKLIKLEIAYAFKLLAKKQKYAQ